MKFVADMGLAVVLMDGCRHLTGDDTDAGSFGFPYFSNPAWLR
jgi:hypothetical protein